MVETQIVARGVRNPRVIDAMRTVPRHLFVEPTQRAHAYDDGPVPIGGSKQTVSQPYIVALMTDLLDLSAEDAVLEIGTGLGYQAAVLAELARKVYSVEIIEELAQQARLRLGRHGYKNIEFKVGNGYYGWPEHAPFDKIMVTAAPDLIPGALLQQLKPGGKMVIPAGLAASQELLLVEKDPAGAVSTREILPVRFSQLEGTESERLGGS
ncbi:MAG: protein-L-isoaspartate(D-aspartate) O-methyltransferase [Acidobacteriota bacterium]|nr:protein-L-isoaspartate(D-aspartate) O-methyltransferase [Acidobacteriota bacterium]